ncbi:hypothetical protein [Mycoplasmopsis agalactiae]|nr:hypothetical protein [Mycoplasmopsis agalactiae]
MKKSACFNEFVNLIGKITTLDCDGLFPMGFAKDLNITNYKN